jgi:hypothetical protein
MNNIPAHNLKVPGYISNSLENLVSIIKTSDKWKTQLASLLRDVTA